MTSIDTGTEDLLAEVVDGVAVLTMNRPHRRNALSQPMLGGLATVLAQLDHDESVRCVVLTGAGGAFCAGGDVKGMAESPTDSRGDRHGRTLDAAIHAQRTSQRETSGRLWSMTKPTIAAICGPVAGAGLSLALACDLRYAVEGAVLTTAFARVGLAGDYGGTWFLSQLVGSGRAKELYFFSEKITAERAEEIGVVNEVFPAATFDVEVMKRARRLASGPAVAYRYMKENLNRAVGGELGECMDLEVTHHIHTSLTDDHREAALSFVEKREPQFRGR
jgi:2-(1,2-epoxy-1,2-dihydrophenyl)acetyl-CoA isomerase